MQRGLYILAMETVQPSKAIQMDIKLLEQRVDDLINTCSDLQQENDTLRLKQDSLMAERAELIEKTELARTRVEAMINRLKAMENGL